MINIKLPLFISFSPSMHYRKNRRENRSEAKKQATHIVKQGLPKPKQMGQKVVSTSSVYPAEKLRLGI